MTTGTKSLLFGVHQVVLHPLFVAVAWWRLYGCPRDPRLWVAFFVHDLGYVGKRRMNDRAGELHPNAGGRIMTTLFGPEWGAFTCLHSRAYACRCGASVSPLCAADKLATALMPAWLYLPLATLSGELQEYMASPASRAAAQQGAHDGTPYGWFIWLRTVMRQTAYALATVPIDQRREA